MLIKCFLIFLLCIFSSCGKKEPQLHLVNFIFQVPIAVAPTRTSYTIGDTLWLNADFSNQLSEFYSKNIYSITPSNFNINTGIGIRYLSPDKYLSNQIGAMNSFKFVSKIGNIDILGPTFGSIDYDYNKDQYHLLVGIIPKDKGVFCINFFSNWGVKRHDSPWPDLSFINLPSTTAGELQKANYQTTFYYVNNNYNNFDLLNQNSKLALSDYPDDSNINYEKEATYTFIVK